MSKFNEAAAVEKVLRHCIRIHQIYVGQRGDLRRVSQKTFKIRKSEPDFPYMNILETDRNGKVTLLFFIPTKAQAEMNWLFNLKGSEHEMCKYTLRIGNVGVLFQEWTGSEFKVLFRSKFHY